jgi:hypothetical protein
MHAHNQTYIARLGFNDPDRNTMRHEDACQYLIERSTLEKIRHHLILPSLVKSSKQVKDNDFRGEAWETFGEFGTPEREIMVQKGEGKFATTIGFLDAVVPFTINEHRQGESSSWQSSSQRDVWKPFKSRKEKNCRLVFEVKISHTNIGEIIRQLNFYRGYYTDVLHSGGGSYSTEADGTVVNRVTGIKSIWVLATDFPLLQSDERLLEQANISWIRLGHDFTHYEIERESERADLQKPDDPTKPFSFLDEHEDGPDHDGSGGAEPDVF